MFFAIDHQGLDGYLPITILADKLQSKVFLARIKETLIIIWLKSGPKDSMVHHVALADSCSWERAKGR